MIAEVRKISACLRWRWWTLRERAGRRIGGWIAGVELAERDDR